MNSREKGKRGELEFAKFLRGHGYTGRRGQQFSGGEDSPDVVTDAPFHPEVKRTEKLEVYAALEQATRDAGELEVPVVFHRRNNKRWVAILDAEDLLRFVRLAQGGK